MMKKIAYFSCQLPYPPSHGGQVDDWRRLKAFKAAGTSICLTTWYPDWRDGGASVAPHIASLHEVADSVHAWPISTSWPARLRRFWGMRRWPASVASRIPTHAQLAQLWATLDANPPDAVWLDSMHPMVVAQLAAQRYKVPLYYRSHNREHGYMRAQVQRSTHWRQKLAWAMNLPHLKKSEELALRSSAVFFDISADDLALWQQAGFTHGVWLPPLVEPQTAARLNPSADNSGEQLAPPAYDIAYLGNLYAPNNVEGMLWFLADVLPRIQARQPGVTTLIAGSRPVEAIRKAVAAASNVTLIENAPDAASILTNGKVLINPVFAGSGVNVKSVEMLFTNAHIVSSPQGVAGLPPHVQACFKVADDAQAFATAVLDALAQGPLSNAMSDTAGQALLSRHQARSEFAFSRIQEVLVIMGIPAVSSLKCNTG